ncbi:aldehyde dehydrogenase (NADP(+)) [Spiribacter insolitus]|uniref:Aldehyde dehydrogenase (NADP(+)) n=1 Tax=Spiribacter insolitus TaxID=3122417 RepID=A0ABV3T9A9_9GAMM
MDIATDQFIAGRHSAEGSPSFQAENAITGEPLEPRFHEATPEEVDQACSAAAQAAEAYAGVSLEMRAGLLERIAEMLEASADDFVERAGAETALPEARIRGELARTTGQLRLFAKVVRRGDFLGVRIDHGDPQRQPAPKPDLRQYRIPLGPVAVFGASNFPLAFSVCGGDTASALASGCPVVVKAHPAHPGTSAIAAQAVENAVSELGLPGGVFSMLQGAGHDLGAALVRNADIQAVGFTGSQRGGLALQQMAATRPSPIPVYAEMGSVNPLFILPAALEERPQSIASGLAGSFTLGCGQFCTKPGLVFAIRGAGLDAFCETLAGAVEGMTATPMLHGGILSAYEAGCTRLEGTVGVERLAAGGSADHHAQARAYRTDFEHFRADPALAEEVFGPVTLVVTLESMAELQAAADNLQGQLTAGIHATEAEAAANGTLLRLLQRRAGRVLFNGYPTGVEVGEAMVHGGPYPATTDSRSTSVGTLAIDRFLRPVALQDMPDPALPPALQDANPLGLPRLVDGEPEPGASR